MTHEDTDDIGNFDNMLKCAFPKGVPDDEHWPLTAVLHGTMTFRSIGRALEKITSKDNFEIY